MEKKLKFSYRTEMNLDLPDSGVLVIKSKGSRSAGLSYLHNIEIFVDDMMVTMAKDFDVPYSWNLAEVFVSAMLEAGIYAEAIAFLGMDKKPYSTVIDSYQDEYRVRFDLTNDYEQLLRDVRLENGEHYRDSKYFEFQKYVCLFNGKLIVDYRGHEVGGSYVPDTEVIPGYIKRIQEATSSKCRFVDRSNGGFGCDIYRFEIDL